mgnify:CR=1 FL=1
MSDADRVNYSAMTTVEAKTSDKSSAIYGDGFPAVLPRR